MKIPNIRTGIANVRKGFRNAKNYPKKKAGEIGLMSIEMYGKPAVEKHKTEINKLLDMDAMHTIGTAASVILCKKISKGIDENFLAKKNDVLKLAQEERSRIRQQMVKTEVKILEGKFSQKDREFLMEMKEKYNEYLEKMQNVVLEKLIVPTIQENDLQDNQEIQEGKTENGGENNGMEKLAGAKSKDAGCC